MNFYEKIAALDKEIGDEESPERKAELTKMRKRLVADKESEVNGEAVACPVDPQEELQCDSCQ